MTNAAPSIDIWMSVRLYAGELIFMRYPTFKILDAKRDIDAKGHVAWSDRRFDWETFFNRVNTKGEKLGPDVAVSDLDGVWSLGTSPLGIRDGQSV